MAQANDRSANSISASCPGGMARQFRVQVPCSDTPARWKLVGAFRDRRAAALCADRLRESGANARVVECTALPTAA